MINTSKRHPEHSTVDWQNTNKPGQYFRKFKIFRTWFENSILKGCNFSAVTAKYSCFIKANLTGTNFTGENLEGANFSNAYLTNVNYRNANLSKTNFERAIIDGASFVNTSIKLARMLKKTQPHMHEIDSAIQVYRKNATSRLDRHRVYDKEGNGLRCPIKNYPILEFNRT